MGDGDYLHVLDEIVIPIGREFAPDLVISKPASIPAMSMLTFQFLLDLMLQRVIQLVTAM